MRSRSIASSCIALHHKAALIRGWCATMSMTIPRPTGAIRVGPIVPMEWSIVFTRNTCRSKEGHAACDHKGRSWHFALDCDDRTRPETFLPRAQRVEQPDILVRERRE